MSNHLNKGNTDFFLPEKAYENLPLPVIVISANNKLIYNNLSATEIFGSESFAGWNTKGSSGKLSGEIFKKINCFFNSGKNSSSKIKVDINGKERQFIPAFSRLVNDDDVYIILLTEATSEENLKSRVKQLKKNFSSIYTEEIDENIILTRLNEAVMQSANTIVITDLKGNILFANPKFEETTGYTLQEALMKNPRILKSGDQSDDYYNNLWETISSGKSWKGEFKNKKKSGEFYWESATISPIKNAKGEIVEYLAIKEDITDRKNIEEKLEKTIMNLEISNWEYKRLNEDLQKEIEIRRRIESELQLQKELLLELNESLESQVDAEVKKNRQKDELMLLQSRQAAMGEMIGNIAHQWRQPLNTIGLMIYDLTDAIRFGEITPEYLEKREKELRSVLDHMSGTIDDFRNFFKPNKEKIDFNLDDVIRKSVSFIDATFRNSGIKIMIETEKNVILSGYPNEFAQVLLNIINNSRDALLENEKKNPGIRISGNITDGKYACVKIIDNGGGIPNHILHKIFDPYFSTKEQGKGTGVGLYMSKTIIEKNMNGSISAQNIRNGAEFTIIIPLKNTELASEIEENNRVRT
jgi:PAS domain S-box-containing protein